MGRRASRTHTEVAGSVEDGVPSRRYHLIRGVQLDIDTEIVHIVKVVDMLLPL